MVPTYPKLMKLVRKEEALLDEKNQGSQTEKVSAHSVQVESSTQELDSNKESEMGECSAAAFVQSVLKSAPAELLAQVVQAHDNMQQALFLVMEAQAKMQVGKTDSWRLFQCVESGHFRVQCPPNAKEPDLVSELLKVLQKLLLSQKVGNFKGSQ